MMGDPVSPSVVQAFYQAYFSREPARIAPFLAEDVDWMVAGPADVLPFCGPRRGKAAVIELFERLVPDVFDARSFEPEELLIDGDRVATFVKISGVQCSTGRIISYHVAQFVRFRDGKVVSYRSVIDSFDAAEQWVGHRIDVAPEQDSPLAPTSHVARSDDVVAV